MYFSQNQNKLYYIFSLFIYCEPVPWKNCQHPVKPKINFGLRNSLSHSQSCKLCFLRF